MLTAGDKLDGIAALEPSAIEHMNKDHPETLALYARHFGKLADPAKWILTGIDADGFDLVSGERSLRIFFEAPLTEPEHVHKMLVEMAKTARQAEEPHVT